MEKQYFVGSEERNNLVDKLLCKALEKFEQQIDECSTCNEILQLVLAIDNACVALSHIRNDTY